jgi:hypothetical protein
MPQTMINENEENYKSVAKKEIYKKRKKQTDNDRKK